MANNNQNNAAPQEVQLTKFEGLFLKYKKQLGIAVAVIIVAVVGVLCYQMFISEPRENEASTKLAQAQSNFDQTMVAAFDDMSKGNYEKALNGEKGKTLGFIQIIDQYSGTKAGNLAKLYAGLCYAQLGKNKEAQQYLEDFDTKDDAFVSPAALGVLGDVYANQKNLDKAVETFKKAAKNADAALEIGHNDDLSPVFLVKAGRILESQNKQNDALELYKEIKTKYLSSPLQGEIDKYIERCTK